MNTRPLALSALAGLNLFLSAAAFAGPINPPAGPVTSTYKTLGEVEPRTPVQSLPGSATALYVISQPGSYYLTGNITGVSGKSGIQITSDNVSLDLAGFQLSGVAGSADGITIPPVVLKVNLSISNGSVSGWGGSGIQTGWGRSGRIDNVRAWNNVGSGIVAGPHSIVTDCQAMGNTVYGIQVSDRATVRSCLADENVSDGFHVGTSSNLLQCTATSNGAVGIFANPGANLNACTCNSNTLDGFRIGDSSSLAACTAAGNGATGIYGGFGVSVTGCTAAGNTSHGIQMNGIGATVSGCTARANAGDGIWVGNGAYVLNCSCQGNGLGAPVGAGIHALGQGNRIDSNTSMGNDIGIKVDSTNNFIARNTVSFNPTGSTIAANNTCAEWIVTPGAAFVGTDPWANFQH
jgi:parallel beta-helix repeat protein